MSAVLRNPENGALHHRAIVLLQAWLLGMIVVSALAADTIELDGQSFEIPAGFTLELAASSQLVPRPIVADFNDQGDLFVADSSGSNDDVQTQLRERPHRLLRLRDTNQDGVFDERTVFADQLMFPEGVMCFRGSVYVAAPPQIWKLTDRDGDGVSDERTVWFDGQTLTGCANDLHGPYRGRDGWIYWCKGAFAEQTYTRADGSSWTTRAAHIFRQRPEGGLIEPVMTGGMDNPVDVVFTRGGERIFTTTFLQHPAGGRRDGLIHAVYGGVYGKIHGVLDGHPLTGDYLPPLTHLGPAAPCGLTVLNSSAWGEAYHDNLLSCAFNLHQVIRHVLEPRGATFVSHDEPLVTGTSLDFHPTDVVEDADGSVLIVNTGGWYKLCCPSSQLQKPDVLGGIYRLRRASERATDGQPVDPRGVTIDWQHATASELATYLSDPRWVVQQRAVDELAQRGDSAHGELRRALAPTQSPTARCNAVWASAASADPRAGELLRLGVADSDSTVRQAAWHAVAVRRDTAVAAELGRGLSDPATAVRRVAAEAAGRLGHTAALPELLRALTSDVDRVMEHSLTFALCELGDAVALRQSLPGAPPAARRALLIALDQCPDGDLGPDDVVPSLTDAHPVVREAAAWIARRHADWSSAVAAEINRHLPALVSARDGAEQLNSLAVHFATDPAVQQIWADALRRREPNDQTRQWALRQLQAAQLKSLSGELQQALALGVADDDQHGSSETLQTLLSLPCSVDDARLVTALRQLLNRPSTPLARRAAALTKLADQAGAVPDECYQQLLTAVTESELFEERRSAAAALTVAPASVAQLSTLVEQLPRFGPAELPAALAALRRSSDSALGLRAWRLLSGSSGFAVVSADLLRESFAGFDADLRRQIDERLEARRLQTPDQGVRLAELLDTLPPGDVRRGQVVFHSAKAACFACHAMGYRGGDVGPDLTRIGGIRNRRDLLESIAFPSVSFVRSFEPQMVVTHSGQILQGVIRNESAATLTLVDAQRQLIEIPRTEVEEVNPSAVSIMPSGLDQLLSPQELADLVAFLEAAK